MDVLTGRRRQYVLVEGGKGGAEEALDGVLVAGTLPRLAVFHVVVPHLDEEELDTPPRESNS
jgi:hypothetical protein